MKKEDLVDIKLKNCPICNSNNVSYNESYWSYVSCNDCRFCTSSDHYIGTEVCNIWNDRSKGNRATINCPLCGNSKIEIEKSFTCDKDDKDIIDGYYVSCSKCFAYTSYKKTINEAINMWCNRLPKTDTK